MAISGFLVCGLLALIFGEKSFVWAMWAMVAVLFLLFGWFVSTVVSRPITITREDKR
jgi:hypothetical protein